MTRRWSDIRWEESRIRISKRYAKGRNDETKTRSSDSFVPLHPILAEELRAWRAQTPYGKPEDFIFPSLQKKGKVPIWASTFIKDHKGKVQAKTVQGLLRHATIKTTLDLYTQEDNDETREAQGAFLSAMGFGSLLLQECVG